MKTSLLIGVFWALWHYPVIIHTKFIYADRPLGFALIAFTIVVISSSFIYNYVRTTTGSVWPCIFLHAFQNYIAFILVEPFEMSSRHLSLFFKNDIGIYYALVMALVALWCVRKMERTRLARIA